MLFTGDLEEEHGSYGETKLLNNNQSLKDIQASLNLKLVELKNLQNIKTLATKSIQLDSLKNTIEDLRQKERVLKYKLNKRIVKLRSAFPTMKSQNITEFLNQKFEAIKKDKKER